MTRKSNAQRKLEKAAALREAIGAIEKPRKVIGLDLSFNSPGFAVVYDCGSMQTEHIKLKNVSDDQRLLATASKAMELALGASVPADLIVIEDYFATNDAGTKVVLAHGAVRVMLAAGGWSGPILTVHNSTLKSFALGGENHVGDGKAPIIAIARERFGLTSYDGDEADAALLAHFGWAVLGAPKGIVSPWAAMVIEAFLDGKAVTAKRKREVQKEMESWTG